MLWMLLLQLAMAHGAVNPAVTPENLAATVCARGWTATVRPPLPYTAALKRSLLRGAGLPRSAGRRYELDHKVPLEVGGAPKDPANLWLQPWDGPAGAHAKDRVEDAVHRALCAGTISLPDAQAVFLGGDQWKAYAVR